MNRRKFLYSTILGLFTLNLNRLVYSNIHCDIKRYNKGTYYLFFDAFGNSYQINILKNMIMKHSKDNSKIWTIGSTGNKPGFFNQPVSIATDKEYRIFVLDHGNDRVQVFDQSGKFLYKFGSFGHDDNHLFNPKGNLLIENNSIYICDEGNHRINIFSLDGKSLSIIKNSGSENRNPFRPSDIAFDSVNSLYIIDSGNSKINVYFKDGRYSHSFGTEGRKPGQFIYPCSIVIDRKNNILIADSAEGFINIFSNDGYFIDRFQLFYPDGRIAIPIQLVFNNKNLLNISTIPSFENT